MYTTTASYEAYTGGSAPSDYTRQELLATTLFKSIYPNFPSEAQYGEFDTETAQLIEYAIFEQIYEGVDYTGVSGDADSFSVGNFSISNGSTNQADRVAFMALTFLQAAGVTYKGVGSC